MKVLKEEITPCNCYGCLKKSTCQCINCGLNKQCKISFCMKEKLNQYTFECNICFSKFRTLDYLKKHRKNWINRWPGSLHSTQILWFSFIFLITSNGSDQKHQMTLKKSSDFAKWMGFILYLTISNTAYQSV